MFVQNTRPGGGGGEDGEAGDENPDDPSQDKSEKTADQAMGDMDSSDDEVRIVSPSLYLCIYLPIYLYLSCSTYLYNIYRFVFSKSIFLSLTASIVSIYPLLTYLPIYPPFCIFLVT